MNMKTLSERFPNLRLYLWIIAGYVVVIAFDNCLETFHGIGDLHVASGRAGELFGDVKRLRQEALNLASASDGEFLIFGQFVDTLVFILIAFSGVIPNGELRRTFLHAWLVKVAYETLARMEDHLKENKLPLDPMSCRVGRRLTVDSKDECFVHDTEADRLLTREYREGFVVPKKI